MRILLLTPYYFPLENPRAYRWTKIVKSMVDDGMEVTVITAGDHIRTVTHVGESIIRCGYSTPDKRLSKEIGPQRKTVGRGWGKRFMRSWMWPDESMFWIKPALKAAKRELKKGMTDVVISVSHPFSSHIISSRLRSEFDFKWLVDIGDPFVHQDYPPRNNPKLWKSKNKRAEEAVLTSCDVIAVTNSALKELYSKEYKIDSDKVKVVPPMHSSLPETWPDQGGSRHFNIGYYGTFYDGVRSPELILEARKSMITDKAIEWHFYGGIKSHHKETLEGLREKGDLVHFHGTIIRKKVIGSMASMDILLNVGNNTALQVPSKLVDYLAAQKPILHLSQREDDCSTSFLSDHDGIITWKAWKPAPLSITKKEIDLNRNMSDYSPERIGKEYLKSISFFK